MRLGRLRTRLQRASDKWRAIFGGKRTHSETSSIHRQSQLFEFGRGGRVTRLFQPAIPTGERCEAQWLQGLRRVSRAVGVQRSPPDTGCSTSCLNRVGAIPKQLADGGQCASAQLAAGRGGGQHAACQLLGFLRCVDCGNTSVKPNGAAECKRLTCCKKALEFFGRCRVAGALEPADERMRISVELRRHEAAGAGDLER